MASSLDRERFPRSLTVTVASGAILSVILLVVAVVAYDDGPDPLSRFEPLAAAVEVSPLIQVVQLTVIIALMFAYLYALSQNGGSEQ
jgi:hypothetical protein